MIEIMSDDLMSRLLGFERVERRYAAGQFLFRQGDAVQRLYVVRAGEVHLVRYQPGGSALTLQRAGGASVLAEASLFSEHYHCDGVARGTAEVSAVERSRVLAAFASDPGFAEAWCRHFGREVQAARLRAEILTLRTVSERLDAWLGSNGGRMPPKGDWKSVAAEIGTSPEALYRELARRRKTAG